MAGHFLAPSFVMSMLWPTETEQAGLTTLPAVIAFAGVQSSVFEAFSTHMGNIASVRVLGLLPAASLAPAIQQVRVTVPRSGAADAAEGEQGEPTMREVTAVETVNLIYAWRLARRLLGLDDVDPLAPPPPTVTVAQGSVPEFREGLHRAGGDQGQVARGEGPSASEKQPPTKKIKVNNVLDQQDESEIRHLSRDAVRRMFDIHVEVTGDEPLTESEPTADQLSAMYDRVVARDEEPYADFSILTPLGKKIQKSLKLRGWLPQADGSYLPCDLPGPPTFAAWTACWRVYQSVMTMMQYPVEVGVRTVATATVTPAGMEEYFRHFDALQAEFPECWWLCVMAEDTCRNEHFARLRRELERVPDGTRNRFNVLFDSKAPWKSIFSAAARDEQYWDKHVRRPALAYLTRGSTSAMPSISPQASSAVAAILGKHGGGAGGHGSAGGDGGHPGGGGLSRSQIKKQRQRAAKAAAAQQPAGGSGAGKGTIHQPWQKGKGKSGGPPYRYDRDNNEICFKFAKGGRGACDDVCPQGRSHSCQFCLGPHPNSECSQKGKKGGKGKNAHK